MATKRKKSLFRKAENVATYRWLRLARMATLDYSILFDKCLGYVVLSIQKSVSNMTGLTVCLFVLKRGN